MFKLITTQNSNLSHTIYVVNVFFLWNGLFDQKWYVLIDAYYAKLSNDPTYNVLTGICTHVIAIWFLYDIELKDLLNTFSQSIFSHDSFSYKYFITCTD